MRTCRSFHPPPRPPCCPPIPTLRLQAQRSSDTSLLACRSRPSFASPQSPRHGTRNPPISRNTITHGTTPTPCQEVRSYSHSSSSDAAHYLPLYPCCSHYLPLCSCRHFLLMPSHCSFPSHTLAAFTSSSHTLTTLTLIPSQFFLHSNLPCYIQFLLSCFLSVLTFPSHALAALPFSSHALLPLGLTTYRKSCCVRASGQLPKNGVHSRRPGAHVNIFVSF